MTAVLLRHKPRHDRGVYVDRSGSVRTRADAAEDPHIEVVATTRRWRRRRAIRNGGLTRRIRSRLQSKLPRSRTH